METEIQEKLQMMMLKIEIHILLAGDCNARIAKYVSILSGDFNARIAKYISNISWILQGQDSKT